MNRVIATSSLIVLAALLPSVSRAAYPLVVDDAGVHPPGETRWDVTADALRTPDTDALSANLFLAAGLLPRLEGSLAFGYGWARDRSPADAPTRDGVLDLSVGLKAPIVLDDSAPFAFTLSTSAKLPTASARLGLGTGFADFSVLAIATRSWGALSLDLNAGFTWTALGHRTERAGDAWFTGAALRWQATSSWLLFAETYAALPADGLTEPTAAVRTGWQVELHPGVLLAGAVGTGYGRHAVEALGTVGLTIIY